MTKSATPSKSDTCEWGSCERAAEYRLVFAAPADQVAYCGDCIQKAKLELDYQGVVPA